jgi:hypothetical protein
MSYSSTQLAVPALLNKGATFIFTIFKFQFVMRHDPIERGTLLVYTV